MDFYTWVFENPRRAAGCVAGFFLVLVLGMASVLGYRIHQLSHAGARPQAAATTLPIVTSDAQPSVGLQATAAPLPQASDSSFAYPAAGDPLPTGIDVANYYLASDFQHLEGDTEPATYEDLSGSPVSGKVEVDGEASTTESGPTQAEVTVPTNGPLGDLIIDLRTDGGKWKAYGVGWSDNQ